MVVCYISNARIAHIHIIPHAYSGVNDALEDARRLAEMTEGLDCVVNLIEFNTHEGAVFRGSPRERVSWGCMYMCACQGCERVAWILGVREN